jgi:hypothetical protein
VAWKTLVGCLAIGTILSGCSTPKERAQARERARAYELRQAEQRANSYKDTCATYGYEVGTPQFNQCVATEKRQYEAEQRDAQAARERKALETKMARQAKKERRRGSGLPMCQAGGGGIAALCD